MHQLGNPENLAQILNSRNGRTKPPSSLCIPLPLPLFEHIGKEETNTHSTLYARRETKAVQNAVTRKSRKSSRKRRREEEEEETDVDFSDATTAGKFSKLDRRLGAPIGKRIGFCTPNGNNLPIKPAHPPPPPSHVKRRRR